MKLPSLPSTPFKKSELVIYDPLPIIEHIFREPEKRPSQIVSDAFSVVCLLPLLVLLILVNYFFEILAINLLIYLIEN